ncbi:MAG: hypothetical protein ACON4W_05510 [Parvibaculales bacterium]
MMIDVAVFGYLALGALLGYVNAALKALIKSASLLLPLFVMTYFLGETVLLGREVLALALSRRAEDLGIWGVFAAFVGAGGTVLLLRLMLGLFTLGLKPDKPKMPARLGGAAIGLITNLLLVLIAVQFCLFFLPSTSRGLVEPSLSGKIILPVSESLQPVFADFMAERTQRILEPIGRSSDDVPDLERALQQFHNLPEEDRKAVFERLQDIDFDQLKLLLESQLPRSAD